MTFRVLRDEFWNHIRQLGSREQHVLLFLEGGPLGHFSGIFTCPPVDISGGTGYPEKAVRAAMRDLTDRKLIVFDPARLLVFVPGMVERQLGTKHFNVKHRAGILSQVSRLPKDSPAVRAFFATYGQQLGCLSDKGQEGDTDGVSDGVSDTPTDGDADGSENREVRSETEKRELRHEKTAVVPSPLDGGGNSASKENNGGIGKDVGKIPESQMRLIQKAEPKHQDTLKGLLVEVKAGSMGSLDAIQQAVLMGCLPRPDLEKFFA